MAALSALLLAGLGVLVALVVVALSLWIVRKSLPNENGELFVEGLTAPVVIDRDDRGVPVIRAESYLDAMFGLGFAHAQDRFFQMDLSRRYARGTLSELMGERTIETDLSVRRMQLGQAVEHASRSLDSEQRAALQRYTNGVNAGLQHLGAHPPEYLLLRAEPEAWSIEDCLYVELTLMLQLSEDIDRDLERAAMERALDPQIVRAMSPTTTSLDAPMAAKEISAPYHEQYQAKLFAHEDSQGELLSPDVVDWRSAQPVPRSQLWRTLGRSAPLPDDFPIGSFRDDGVEGATPGSNAWAVSGGHTPHGGALLAGDMHLGLSLPGTWYHAQLEWGDGGWSGDRTPQFSEAAPGAMPASGQFVGLTTPGAGHVFAGGSTGTLAFAFTNLHADLSDLVRVRLAMETPGSYLTADGPEPFIVTTTTIDVRGSSPREHTLLATRWGPIVGRAPEGHLYALMWTAREPGALGLNQRDLFEASSAGEAAAQLRVSAGPPMNIILADRAGGVSWAITGGLASRQGYDGRVPVDGTEPGWRWRGIAHDTKPEPVVRHDSGYVYTANNRAVSIEAWQAVGDQPGEPARARRIDELLRSATGTPETASDARMLGETDMRDMLLDTFAYRYAYVKEHTVGVLLGSPSEELRSLGQTLDRWDGTADASSSAYRMARLLSQVFEADIIGRLARDMVSDQTDESRAHDDPSDEHILAEYDLLPVMRAKRARVRNRDIVRAALADRPPHLLPPGHDSWDAYIQDAARYSIHAARELSKPLGEHTPWGALNRLQVAHPLAPAMPESLWLRAQLALPDAPQSGDAGVIRVARTRFGASNRLIVAPSNESEAILQLPGGQSGHPLSEHFRDRAGAWLEGTSSDPLLSGEARSTLTLRPVR